MTLVLAPSASDTAVPGQTRAAARVRPWRVVGRFVLLALVASFSVAAGIFLVTPDGSGFLQAVDDLALPRRVAAWDSAFPTFMTALILVPLITAVIVALAAGLRSGKHALPIVSIALAATCAAVPAMVVRRPAPSNASLLRAANDHSFPSIAAAVMTAAILSTMSVTGSGRTSRRILAASAVVVAFSALRIVTGSAWMLDEVAGIAVGVLAVNVLAPWRRGSRPRAWRLEGRRRSATLGAVAIVVLAAAVPIANGYSAYMRAPGSAGSAQRTVEFFRDHGFGPFVDRAESWWLWSHLPPSHGRLAALPAAPLDVGHATGVPPAIAPVFPSPLRGEGRWTVAARDASGRVQIATTNLRPDPTHPTIVAAVAWLSQHTTRLHLIAGLREPGGGPGPAKAEIPISLRPQTLAAFNSGYRMKDTPGGALVEGRQVRSLQLGLATVAIRMDGTTAIGAWGVDLDPHATYRAIRQNLHLMVRDGRVVDGLATNAGDQWGKVKNALPSWRSGLGITASGDLVYVGGKQLTLTALADTLVRAGAVTGMELDIHKDMVTFNLFSHGRVLTGHKLLPDMTRPASRYLAPDWRDFFVVTSAGTDG